MSRRSLVVQTASRHPVLSSIGAVVTALLLWVVFWYAVAVLAMIAGALLVQWYLIRVMRRPWQ